MRKTLIFPPIKTLRSRAGSELPLIRGVRKARKPSLTSATTTRPSTAIKLFHQRQWLEEGKSPLNQMHMTMDLHSALSTEELLGGEGREGLTCDGREGFTWDDYEKEDLEKGNIEELATGYYEKMLEVLSEGDYFEPLPKLPAAVSPSLKQLSDRLAVTTASLLSSLQPSQHS